MNKTVNITATLNLPIKTKFIDANRHPNDESFLPLTSAVGFITKASDGITIIFKERVNYEPNDKLLLKFDDTYGSSTETTEME